MKWSAESRCVGEVACPLKYNNLFVVCTKNTQLLKCLHFFNHEARIKVSQLVYLMLPVCTQSRPTSEFTGHGRKQYV